MARIIRASQIGEYVYCHRAWWLRAVQGRSSINVGEMAAGTAAHQQHGQTVALSRGLRALAWILFGLALLAALWLWLA